MTQEQIKQYKVLVEFLSNTLGPDYEIALHDLSDKNNSIVAIENGHISGRSVGGPLTNVALKIIAEKSYKNADYKINYSGLSKGNKKLRSCTMFIKDEEGELVGLLCINFDDQRYRELSKLVLQLCHPDSYVERGQAAEAALTRDAEENFPNSMSALTDDVINDVLTELGTQVERLTQEEKLKIIGMLDEKGVFMLKGAVNIAAEKLSCSKASIYRYLGKLKDE
ncbi:MAG: PAS domain-containing protein [Bacillota bacterium]